MNSIQSLIAALQISTGSRNTKIQELLIMFNQEVLQGNPIEADLSAFLVAVGNASDINQIRLMLDAKGYFSFDSDGIFSRNKKNIEARIAAIVDTIPLPDKGERRNKAREIMGAQVPNDLPEWHSYNRAKKAAPKKNVPDFKVKANALLEACKKGGDAVNNHISPFLETAISAFEFAEKGENSLIEDRFVNGAISPHVAALNMNVAELSVALRSYFTPVPWDSEVGRMARELEDSREEVTRLQVELAKAKTTKVKAEVEVAA